MQLVSMCGLAGIVQTSHLEIVISSAILPDGDAGIANLLCLVLSSGWSMALTAFETFCRDLCESRASTHDLDLQYVLLSCFRTTRNAISI